MTWSHSWGFWLGVAAIAILLGNLVIVGIMAIRYLLQRDRTERAASLVLLDETGRRTR